MNYEQDNNKPNSYEFHFDNETIDETGFMVNLFRKYRFLFRFQPLHIDDYLLINQLE